MEEYSLILDELAQRVEWCLVRHANKHPLRPQSYAHPRRLHLLSLAKYEREAWTEPPFHASLSAGVRSKTVSDQLKGNSIDL